MLTKKAKYALRALSALARNEAGYTQARDIAQDAQVPEKFLETILVELRNACLVESKRGARGGHRLARPAEQINIGEIIRTIDGPLAPIPCASHTRYRPCDDCVDPARCALRLLMVDVRTAMSDVVDTRTLRDLSEAAGPPRRRTKQAKPSKPSSEAA
jgi:Rrf2 family protein